MNKIKIFESDNAARLENLVEDWFTNHPQYSMASYEFGVENGNMYLVVRLCESDAAKKERMQGLMRGMRIQAVQPEIDPWRGEFIPIGDQPLWGPPIAVIS